MQLFCFNYAGGTAAFYDQLGRELSPSMEVIALEYSGHGSRHKENLYNDLNELAEDLYVQMKKVYSQGEIYALMGYSMGCISILQIYKKIMEKQELPKPIYIFLAAYQPYTRKEFLTYKDPSSENLVRKRILEFGGVPERLLNNKTFWRSYLPIYRSDFYLIGTYDFETEKPQIDVPTTLFYSELDSPYEEVIGWKKYLTADVDFIRYEGDHFFIKEHYQEMAAVIKDKLQAYFE